MIPKIVHQIFWNFKSNSHTQDDMPEEWQKMSNNCFSLYNKAGWKYYLWGRKEADRLMRNKFPWCRKTWFLATNIEKVDILRYAIMYIYGGMYLDLDTECIKEYNPPPDAEIVLGATDFVNFPILRDYYGINNNILLSRKKHPFWLCLLHHINSSTIPTIILPNFLRIGMHTGPYRLQRTYNAYPDKKGMIICDRLSIASRPGTTPDLSKLFFLHISAKSWVSISDVIHLFLFIAINVALIVIMVKKTLR